MPKLSSLQPSGTQRVLVYGPPKTGKTELVGRLSESFNLKLFDLEQGKDTLFKLPKEWQERIEVYSLPDTRSWPIASETMLKVIKGGKYSICTEHGKISCLACMQNSKESTIIDLTTLGPNDIVVVDSLTQLTESIIAHITKKQDEDYRLEWEDYQKMGALMNVFLSHVQQAKFNIICITHEIGTELEDGKERIVPVAGTRNYSRNTAKYFDHVVYAEVKNGKHCFGSSTLYTPNVVTGSRTGISLEKQERASLLDIMKGNIPSVNESSASSVNKQTVSLSALRNKLTGNK